MNGQSERKKQILEKVTLEEWNKHLREQLRGTAESNNIIQKTTI